jgi:hypothetical protein
MSGLAEFVIQRRRALLWGLGLVTILFVSLVSYLGT